MLIRVAGSGLGVPATDIHRAFDRFCRAAAAGSTPGSGLGLAIASFVDGASGSIAPRYPTLQEQSLRSACHASRDSPRDDLTAYYRRSISAPPIQTRARTAAERHPCLERGCAATAEEADRSCGLKRALALAVIPSSISLRESLVAATR